MTYSPTDPIIHWDNIQAKPTRFPPTPQPAPTIDDVVGLRALADQLVADVADLNTRVPTVDPGGGR